MFVISSSIGFSQTIEKSDDKIYSLTASETIPEFVGGIEKLNSYLLKTGFKTESKTQANLFAMFVVEKDGTLSDVKIYGKRKPENENEIITILKESPKWKVGKVNNIIVRVKYTLPLIPIK